MDLLIAPATGTMLAVRFRDVQLTELVKHQQADPDNSVADASTGFELGLRFNC